MKIKSFFIGFKKGMESFGKNIALIVNTTLLFIVYVIGVGLTSMIAKLFGKHFMDMKISKRKKSYWADLNLKREPMENYYRMF